MLYATYTNIHIQTYYLFYSYDDNIIFCAVINRLAKVDIAWIIYKMILANSITWSDGREQNRRDYCGLYKVQFAIKTHRPRITELFAYQIPGSLVRISWISIVRTNSRRKIQKREHTLAGKWSALVVSWSPPAVWKRERWVHTAAI